MGALEGGVFDALVQLLMLRPVGRFCLHLVAGNDISADV